MIRCIAAIDEKRGLANEHGIPWNLPTDQKFFVDQTKNGIILMGYGTYLEFKTPMHGRTNYVAISDDKELLPGFIAIHDVPAFFEQHKDELINDIGGAGLFASTIQFADELLLTRVDADFHCTKVFPEFEKDFVCVKTSELISENGITFHFETWKPKL